MPLVTSRKQKGSNRDRSDIGMFTVPDIGDGEDPDGDDEDDGDLENELNAILASGPPKPKVKRPPPQPNPASINLDKMVADSLRDEPSDEDLSGDEDDPSLLAELQVATGVPMTQESAPQVMLPVTSSSVDTLRILRERIGMYKQAEENSKAVGDTMKVRRLGRGLKTLNELVKKAEGGAIIDEADIPMPVSVVTKKPQENDLSEQPPEIFAPLDTDSGLPAPLLPQRVAPPIPPRRSLEAKEVPQTPESTSQAPLTPSSSTATSSKSIVSADEGVMSLLNERREQYKKAAVAAKREGDTAAALQFVKIAKKFDTVIEAASSGHPIDISTMPPPPQGFGLPSSSSVDHPGPSQSHQNHSPADLKKPRPSEGPEAAPASISEERPPPATVLEALEQRLAKFQEQEESAKNEGNNSKVRRMGRIVKQYQDAIRLHKAGKPIPIEELPTPPGFGPIPVPGSTSQKPSLPQPSGSTSEIPLQASAPSIQPPERTIGNSPSPTAHQQLPSQPPPKPASSPQLPGRGSATKQEKQLSLLLQKQKQYKEAALKAKQKGDLKLAKEYLRQFKCFEPLLEATKNGFPVDWNSLPTPPGVSQAIEKDFEIVETSDCILGSTSEVYTQLIADLQHQLKLCMETRAHFKAIGDVANANKFEQLAVSSKKDLDAVKVGCSRDAPIPNFHYERRTYDIVRCNTDLTDNEIEITIVQGVNYNVPNPKEIDTYVRCEFPAPSGEEPKKEKTSTVYNTNNPSYDAKFVLPIPRSNRTFQRLFKRHSLKLEIWSKGGFLRSDNLVGTVNVKLQPLESKCTLHDSFDVMDGRKPLGGKLEVKIRLRHPIQTKQVEQLQEKWLVLDF